MMNPRTSVFSFFRSAKQLAGSEERACGSVTNAYAAGEGYGILAPLTLAVAHFVVTALLASAFFCGMRSVLGGTLYLLRRARPV